MLLAALRSFSFRFKSFSHSSARLYASALVGSQSKKWKEAKLRIDQGVAKRSSRSMSVKLKTLTKRYLHLGSMITAKKPAILKGSNSTHKRGKLDLDGRQFHTTAVSGTKLHDHRDMARI